MTYDRSAFAPRASRQEAQAEREEEMRQEIIEEFKRQGLWGELTEAERDDYVEDTLREWKEPPGGGVTLDWCNPGLTRR